MCRLSIIECREMRAKLTELPWQPNLKFLIFANFSLLSYRSRTLKETVFISRPKNYSKKKKGFTTCNTTLNYYKTYKDHIILYITIVNFNYY